MNPRHADELSATYHYGILGNFIANFAVMLAWFTCIAGALTAEHRVLVIAVIFFLCLGAVGLTRARLARATIVISDAGVAARLLGMQTRFINWHDVTKVVKMRAPAGYGFYLDSFQVYSEDRGIVCRFLLNICGNIAFNERIGGARQLLDQINLHARDHAIPLFVWDLEAIAKQRPLIKPKGQRGRTELPVTEF